ncbi:hypothetical protein BTO04_11675 [Polaribacter sp. SA4-10]|uniref:hypothetical protein n=1 Tax=Polaribacter sp. SA4-10 TaxID=754397 RepID=UPI000B3C851C|nr:hypothetical protein [Polaribacter sp. SA4-10]ARV07306.1 hypothetical protein BTO04_11675 [Polaribacter sp. SA4-10]
MKTNYLIIVFLLFVLSIKSQNENDKWSFGVNLSVVVFSGEGSDKVKDRVNTQFPNIHVSRKLVKNISADFIYNFQLLGFSGIENIFKYTSFDAYLRYDLPETFLKIVPFGGVGLGYIQGPTTAPNSEGSLSLNIMGGGTLWILKRFGLTARLIYKYVSSDAESMASHVQLIGGVVYRFGMNSVFGKRQSRIWDMKH